MKSFKKNWLLWLIVIVTILVSILPLLNSKYPQTHDFNLYPVLQYEFDQGIREGHLLPRWSDDFWLGLGSPVFNFIQPLFFYLAEIFGLIGFSLVVSIKFVIILSFILGFWSMYLLSREFWGKQAAVLTAVVFTLFPYHLAMVYIRGAFAEFLALSLIPLVLFLFIRFIKTKKIFYGLIGSLVLALLFLSHNIQSLFFLPVLIIYLAYVYRKDLKKMYKKTAAFIVLGLGLAAFFILPALFELKHLELIGLNKGDYNYHNFFLSFVDLLPPKWSSYDYFQIGAVGLIILLMSVYYFFIKRRTLKDDQLRNLVFFLTAIFVFSFLSLSASAFFWENLPLVSFAQFPWRLLSYQVLGVSFVSGFLFSQVFFKISSLKKKSLNLSLAGFFIIILVANFVFIKPFGFLPIESDSNYHPFKQAFKDAVVFKGMDPTQENLDKSNSILKNFPLEFAYLFNSIPFIVPRGVLLEEFIKEACNTVITLAVFDEEERFDELYSKINTVSGEINWEQIQVNNYQQTYDLEASVDSKIYINQFWFPGWRAYLDDKQVTIDHDNNLQLMTFDIPQGNHRLELRFKTTLIRRVAVSISLLSLIIWFYLFIKLRNKKSPQV